MFTVFGKTFSASQVHYSSHQKAKTEHSNKQKECSVSELSVVHASTSLSFDATPDFIFQCQSINLPLRNLETFPRLLVTPFYAFHEILFEHVIATNAP